MGYRLTRITIALGLLAAVGQTQETKRELSVLRIPAWPRAAALANIGAATSLPEGLFYNPALAGTVSGLAGSAHFFGSDRSLTTVVTGLSTGLVSIGVGVQLLRADIGFDPLVDPIPGSSATRNHSLTSVTTLGGSMRFKGIRWGASAKYLSLVERGVDADGLAFDLGAQRPIGPFSVGLAVQNLGKGIDVGRDELEMPTRVTLAAEGTGLPKGAFIDLGALAALAVDQDGEVLPAAGGQVIYTPLDGWTFSLRAGVRRPAPSSNERPVTGGFALALDRLTIDYAIEGVKNGDAVHRIGVRFR
ncbi:MAG: hypothetical protein ACRENH_07645 [Gemmatimonadaceae bacterium]